MRSQRYFGARPYWDLAARAGSRTLHLTWAKIGSQCPFTMILMSLEEKELSLIGPQRYQSQSQ